MKPGITSGAGCGALIVLSFYQIAELVNGNLWAAPALIWDVCFAAIGLYQIFGPSVSRPDRGGAAQ